VCGCVGRDWGQKVTEVINNYPALITTLENLAGQDGITEESVYYVIYRFAVNKGATTAQATSLANSFKQVLLMLINKR
jgi:hypothetical protein